MIFRIPPFFGAKKHLSPKMFVFPYGIFAGPNVSRCTKGGKGVTLDRTM